MYSIGIDCAKGKSTVCILTKTGECILSPKDYFHTREDLERLYEKIRRKTGNEDVRVVMEATGIYHWPVLSFLKKRLFCIGGQYFEDEAVCQGSQLQGGKDGQT